MLRYPEFPSGRSFGINLGPGTQSHRTRKHEPAVLTSSLPIDGLKTGHTSEAGYQLVATTEQDGLRLISVVMGTEAAAERKRPNDCSLRIQRL